ncbi:hypothetical protein [Actinomadura macra]|uniref:hypothetical protein n=1 Tax=Actinomadura macra TaxID=46164 RepID=UPI000835B31E|nr:hypothetical protein [Actinomadura macra]
MKSARRGRGAPPVLVRVAGYGAALLLVAAAVVVLLLPLIRAGGDGADATGVQGASGSGATSATGRAVAPGVPSGASDPVAPTTSVPRQSGAPPGTDGGPRLPGQNGSGTGLTWCPQGTAFYREAAGAVDVVITVSASGAVRAELTLRGYAPQSQQAAVRGGAPHTFHFGGVPARLVQRVKVTTVSVGVAMQTCYARAAV